MTDTSRSDTESIPPVPTWEVVIASFIGQADQAQELLESPKDPDLVPAAVSYDMWQHVMPPLPDKLQASARSVYERQLRLTAQLQEAMNAIRLQQALLDVPQLPQGAVFIDQRA